MSIRRPRYRKKPTNYATSTQADGRSVPFTTLKEKEYKGLQNRNGINASKEQLEEFLIGAFVSIANSPINGCGT